MKCAIFLAKGFEDCEALITIDMLRRADIEVDSVSITDDLKVESSHGVTLFADRLWKEINPSSYTALILPGGKLGTENLGAFEPLRDVFMKHWQEEKLTCAICAAPSLFGKWGILKGRRYTCFPDFYSPDYEGNYQMELAVQDRNLITARGMGATIEFARLIIRDLSNEANLKRVEYGMQYEHSFRVYSNQ
ncbi:MAG: DJ-1/PfpI family protein [Solobacterium sp.]|nr:DJ-1/PfpI family protein [Solobacterium sp.]MBR3346961.1 DJ-1/PfpI family protein [Solobacterium sp.]